MRVQPLSSVTPRDLGLLLVEEREYWKAHLLWDFSEVSSGIANGLERGTLTGRACDDGGRTVAYCYYVIEAERGIVGSLFASAAYRGQGIEEQLLDAVVAAAQAASHRVECQTLFSTASHVDARFERLGFVGSLRHYMVRPLEEPVAVVSPGSGLWLTSLDRHDLDAAARVILRSHEGTVDAALNLTYASMSHCRAFVDTLVLRSGCGRFEPKASFLAGGPEGPLAVLIATRLSSSNGHVCQVSVVPEAQSQGIGTVLMTAAMAGFQSVGLRAASLSVTVDNRRAYHLYQRLGFRPHREFGAHAWVRPPARIELPP